MFTTLKLYWRAAVGAVLGVLAIAVTVLAKRLSAVKDQRDAAREHADHAIEVATRDREVDIQVDEHLAEVANGESDELVDPNSWD